MSAPIAILPRGAALTAWFLANWSRLDPKLAEDALDVLPRVGLGLPRPQALDEAIRWIWAEDIALDGPQAEAYLRRLPGAVSSIPFARLQLETRIREILAALVEEIHAGRWRLDGTHPKQLQAFKPDPELLAGLTGSHRSRDQIPTDDGLIRYLRIVATPGYDPAQIPLPLREAPSAPARIAGQNQVNRVAHLMRQDQRADLRAMTGKEMAARYNSSPRTCGRARDIVLAEDAAENGN
jgi:hypothetical protein